MKKTVDQDFGPFFPPTKQDNNQFTAQHDDFRPTTASRTGNGIILTVFFVFGIFVNSLILYLVRKRNVLNKSTCSILLHLAASDLIGCFVVMPMQLVLFVSNIGPEALCIGYYVSTNFTVLVNCGCHVLLSIDRCCSVRQSHSVGIPVFLFKKVLVAIWVVAVGNAVLTALTSRGQNPWVFQSSKPLLDAGTIVLYVFIWLCLAAVFIAVFFVHYTVKKHDEEAGENFGTSNSEKRRRRQKRILKLTTITMTSAVILYLPLMLCEYVYRVSSLQSPSITSFSRILISVSHATNLIIYTGMSNKFRKAAWEELELWVRRANIQSSLTDKKPKRQPTNTKSGASSSVIASDGESTPNDLKEIKADCDKCEKLLRNDVSMDDSTVNDLFLVKNSNKSEVVELKDRKTSRVCNIENRNIQIESSL